MEPNIAIAPNAIVSSKGFPRLASIDALRGLDMLMIAGGGDFIYLLGGKTDIFFLNVIAAQFVHPDWHGFTFYDFIFPLFLFLAGTSIPFSVSGALAKGASNSDILRKAFKRMVILIGLGILDKNAPIDLFDPGHIRYGSVLGRIGIASMVSVWLFLKCNSKQRLFIGIGTLLIYFLIVLLVPVPGFGSGDLSFKGNIIGWFDRTFMPGILKQETYDELALLTTFPAICLAVFGTLAGEILLSERTANAKTGRLLLFGIFGIMIGLLWNVVFPINKHLWSSSFIMLTTGMAFSMLALFYWIIDVKGYEKWSFFFRVIGMNSLLIYLLVRFVSFKNSSQILFGGIYKHAPEQWHDVFNALGGFILVWLLLYFLYRKKIFVKV